MPEEDKRRKALVEARNQADAVIYSSEKALKEAETKIPADLKQQQVEQAVAEAKQNLTSGENAANDPSGDGTSAAGRVQDRARRSESRDLAK